MNRTTLIATLVINHLKIKSPRKGSRKGIKQNHPGLEYFLATGSAAFFVECQCKTPVVVFFKACGDSWLSAMETKMEAHPTKTG
jgi:hypothetical protein